ncbi:MAG: hypothetical protein M3R54_05270 [Chloroflexota bacterium]|nr:hypothetical protein [Chloroflexota bacterium]
MRRVCEAGLDARTLRKDVLRELGKVIDFDGYAWLLTDPLTWVGVAPVADVRWLDELPRQILLKYCTALNRWTDLPSTHVALLHAETEGKLDRSLLWRDFLQAHGVGDVASVVFCDQHGCWGFLELFRDASRGPFALADAGSLADLVLPLTEALRRSQATCFVAGAQEHHDRAGPVMLLLAGAASAGTDSGHACVPANARPARRSAAVDPCERVQRSSATHRVRARHRRSSAVRANLSQRRTLGDRSSRTDQWSHGDGVAEHRSDHRAELAG